MLVYIYIYLHVYIYIYLHVCACTCKQTYREREREGEGERERVKERERVSIIANCYSNTVSWLAPVVSYALCGGRNEILSKENVMLVSFPPLLDSSTVSELLWCFQSLPSTDVLAVTFRKVKSCK